jgi:predicted DCC family thiol-disulfide oxidoreductase YuxK
VDAPVILYDGVCSLCHNAVRFVLARDHAKLFRFAALQSDAARTLLAEKGMSQVPDSVVLIDDAGVHTQSAAALRIARRLGLPWSLAWPAIFLPAPIRDAAYRSLARNRYRWFGRTEGCLVPSPAVRDRFLDQPTLRR